MARHVLARLQDWRTQERNVENGCECALCIVDGRRRAGERGVRDVEMVGLVDGQRLAGGDAGTHGAGAGARFRPFGAEIEPRLAQIVVERGIAQEFDRDTLTIRQEEDIILLGDLPVEPFQPRSGNVNQIFGLLAMLAQPGFGHDDGFLWARRVQLICRQTAPPRVHDDGVAPRVAALPNALDFLDVI